MRTILLDILGLAGYGALCYGLFLRFGPADALISGGAMLLLLALLAARSGKRRELRP